jgi:2-oxoisovalerate dehydrogenase E2 component (dihydrolipoyl transacylase)
MGVTPIKMPQLGESVTEGTVDRWLKQEGDYVHRDEPIVEVVTDKVNAEIPSPFEGTLVRISVAEGATVPIGTEIAQMEVEGAPVEAPPVAAPVSEPAEPSAAAVAPTAAQRPRFSPAVRRLAEEHDIDPSEVAGTGLGGRVTRDDVLAFVEARDAAGAVQPSAASVPRGDGEARVAAASSADGAREQLVKLSVMRRSIAEHMTRSLATSPHAWTMQEIDVTELVRYRESEKEGFRQRHEVSLTYLPFVIQVVCDALHELPYLNSSWTDDGILLKKYVNMGVAVAIPDGLIVPVIRDADRLGFTDLVRAMDDLVQRARSKQLKPEEVQSGTFTLNNTGATGSVASQPIINQPQAAILTTESIARRPVVIGEGIAVRHMMNMCLSFDHRIVDGMMAGQFLGSIKRRLEAWTPASIRI